MREANTGRDERIPVILITGFLGSGKTTLLRRMLDHSALARSAVLVNEFGDVAIDDRLVRARAGELVTLESGCLCCSLRDGLTFTLRDLDRRCRNGEIPAIDRVLIETTGLADPAPILLSLATDDTISEHYRLAGVLVTVDTANGWRQLDRQPEAVRQLAAADQILLTKIDLAESAEVERLADRVEAINPGAAVHRVLQGEIAPDRLLSENTGPAAPSRAAFEAPHDHSHDPDLDCFSVAIDTPPERRAFETWLTILLAHRADDLLRIKGVLRFAGEDHSVLVNGLGGLLHPFEPVGASVAGGGPSHLVFITRRLPASVIRESLRAAIDLAAA